MALLGQKTWDDDEEIKKLWLLQKAQNIDLGFTVFEEKVNDKSFIETCNFLIYFIYLRNITSVF
jgi:hypothetical protein